MKRPLLMEASSVCAAVCGSSAVSRATKRLPNAIVSSQKLMIMLFISGAASRKANSSPVVETKTSAAVTTT